MFAIPRLVVPEASLRPQAYGYPAFAEMCRHIGAKLLKGDLPSPSDHTIFLSKAMLPQGVKRLSNESALREVLERAGIVTIYPEQLSLVCKLRLFLKHKRILSVAMSGLHATAFLPTTARFDIISPERNVNSNFYLIDKLANNNSHYWHAPGSRRTHDNAAFVEEHMIDNPAAVAKELLSLL